MAAPEGVLDKLPPQNLDAEMSVLGAMLLDREAIGHAIEAVSAESFYKEAHAKIYAAIVELFDANHPVDIITLTEHQGKRKEIEAVGGASGLVDRLAHRGQRRRQVARVEIVVEAKQRNLLGNPLSGLFQRE